jgi:hypothetical protein
MNNSKVNFAFQTLLGEIEEVFNIVNKEIEEFFETYDFDKAKTVIEYSE